MGDTLSKQMSSTETLPFKEEQAHCNNKTSENQPKIIDDNKCTDSQNTDSKHTDSQNTDSQNTDSSEVYSMALNKDWHLYVMI